MRIIEPSFEILTEIDGDKILKRIERAARTCYKSEDKITENSDSAKMIIKMLLDKHHEAMIEFDDVTVKIITDIGAQRDLSRHRHINMACESTRYCAYNKGKFGGELTFIKPCNIIDEEMFYWWKTAMMHSEQAYMKMAELGCKPDQMRMLLPLSTKTEFCIKANLREWRHIFKMRCQKAAHPSVRQIMLQVLNEFKKQIPVIFDDLIFEE